MQEMIKVAVDAMGGDNAPAEMVRGAVGAVTLRQDIKVALVGQQDIIKEELEKCAFGGSQIEIVQAEEVIETAEPPVMAIRKKKKSSIVIGMNMVKDGSADAFVSAGSSGAICFSGFQPTAIRSAPFTARVCRDTHCCFSRISS